MLKISKEKPRLVWPLTSQQQCILEHKGTIFALKSFIKDYFQPKSLCLAELSIICER